MANALLVGRGRKKSAGDHAAAQKVATGAHSELEQFLKDNRKIITHGRLELTQYGGLGTKQRLGSVGAGDDPIPIEKEVVAGPVPMRDSRPGGGAARLESPTAPCRYRNLYSRCRTRAHWLRNAAYSCATPARIQCSIRLRNDSAVSKVDIRPI